MYRIVGIYFKYFFYYVQLNVYMHSNLCAVPEVKILVYGSTMLLVNLQIHTKIYLKSKNR